MKNIFWFIVIFTTASIFVQSQDVNKKVYDENKEREILVGYCDRAGLQEGEFGEMYFDEYDNYVADKKTLKRIRKHKDDYEILLVLASWCHDSKEQVPRFLRIMDDAKLSSDIMTMVCVNGQKKCETVDISDLNIERVPTFIFYRDNKEIGRIIETPDLSLEQDMLKIISQ